MEPWAICLILFVTIFFLVASQVAMTFAAFIHTPEELPGNQGAIGKRGPPGPAGVMGFVGNDGLTGYFYNLPIPLYGMTGPTGPTGPNTADGPQGPMGPIGPTGPNTGATGPRGPRGATPSSGSLGPPGAVGPTGPTGMPGLSSITAIYMSQTYNYGPTGAVSQLETVNMALPPMFDIHSLPTAGPPGDFTVDTLTGTIGFNSPPGTAYIVTISVDLTLTNLPLQTTSLAATASITGVSPPGNAFQPTALVMMTTTNEAHGSVATSYVYVVPTGPVTPMMPAVQIQFTDPPASASIEITSAMITIERISP